MPVDPAAVAVAALKALADLDVPAALCGGLAMDSWLMSRGQFGTDDADVAVLARSGHPLDLTKMATSVAASLEGQCHLREPNDFGDVQILPVDCGQRKLVRLDVVLADAEYAEHAITHAVRADVQSQQCLVLRPEDVILYKALGQRRKDVEKIAKLAAVHPPDLKYLESWGRHLNRWQYLEAALRGEFHPDKARARTRRRREL